MNSATTLMTSHNTAGSPKDTRASNIHCTCKSTCCSGNGKSSQFETGTSWIQTSECCTVLSLSFDLAWIALIWHGLL
jgi:hypothetical protein